MRCSRQLVQTNGQTYTDLCVKELDGAACNQPLRGMTRFWGNSFEAYNVNMTWPRDLSSLDTIVDLRMFPILVSVCDFVFTFLSTTSSATSAI